MWTDKCVSRNIFKQFFLAVEYVTRKKNRHHCKPMIFDPKCIPRRKSKQLCCWILFAPQENWFCLPSPALRVLWKRWLVCKNYCILGQGFKSVKRCLVCLKRVSLYIKQFLLNSSDVLLLFHTRIFFGMHFNGYLRVPVCLGIWIYVPFFFCKASAQCRLLHQYHQMTGSCSWNNM